MDIAEERKQNAISCIRRNGGKIRYVDITMFVTMPPDAGLKLWGARDCLVNHFRVRPSYT